MKTIEILKKINAKIKQIMKILKFHMRIMKIMKILEFHLRITKIMIFFRIACENHENHDYTNIDPKRNALQLAFW